MNRDRKSWYYASHDRVLRDQFAWNLPEEALGVLKRLECMVGSTVKGYNTGCLYSESGDRMTVEDLIFVLGAREGDIRYSLTLLAQAKQIKSTYFDLQDEDHLQLCFWKTDQTEGGRK